jgi:hypothetical protein
MADDERDARESGRWETSPAGGEWQLDFHLTYRRSSGEM